jgi:hypothetical protein
MNMKIVEIGILKQVQDDKRVRKVQDDKRLKKIHDNEGGK